MPVWWLHVAIKTPVILLPQYLRSQDYRQAPLHLSSRHTYIHPYIHSCVSVCVLCVNMPWHYVWRSEDSLQKWILPPCKSGNQTKVVRLNSSSLLYLLSPLTGPSSLRLSSGVPVGWHFTLVRNHRLSPYSL